MFEGSPIFATDFRTELDAALSLPPDFAAAATWRDACNWDRIAELTMDGIGVRPSTSSVAWLRIVEAQGCRVIARNAQIETVTLLDN